MGKEKRNKQKDDSTFSVVGIGASAGGLKALQEFFDHLPEDNGMAYVVIVHLDPDRTSNMDKLIQSHTKMEVSQVNETTDIKPDQVYVIPPDKQLSVQDNQLILSDSEKKAGSHAAIDHFLRSLAKARGKKAISVVLSGSGTDGTLGLKAIKEYGGIAMVQQPEEAEYQSMPRNAIDTELVDFVLPVGEMAEKVVELKDILSRVAMPSEADELPEKESQALKKIFTKVGQSTGHDFSHYKRSSVLRRIERRMHITRNETITGYVSYLEEHPEEAEELFKDLLISVTNFFRDPEAFEELEQEVIPNLFEGKKKDDEIRVWVTGCATGEEAYSMAILLHEYAAGLDNPPSIKVFATDIDQRALKVAREGWYPETIHVDVTERRLQRFFRKVDEGYQIRDVIKEYILFAPHDLLGDPPFSRQDLITCRNLLIYFNKDLQREVFNLIHYALKTDGYLFLGLSDSPHEGTDLFTSIDKKKGIYQKRTTSESQFRLPHTPLWQNMDTNIKQRYDWKTKNKSRNDFGDIHYKLLARQYAPSSVIINDNQEVIHASEGVNRYLQYGEGEPSRDILEVILPELHRPLRSLLFQLSEAGESYSKSVHTQISRGDHQRDIELIAQDTTSPDLPEGFIQIIFREQDTEESGPEESSKSDAGQDKKSLENEELVEELERELEQTREQLQVTVEEYETSNEELRASNEELQSMNEELQSTTEELETSKEELQSVNEELRAVNEKLHDKIEELSQAYDDIKNLMEATRIGIMFVDRDLCVMRYTSSMRNVFNLIKSDIGRPITDVTHRLDYDNIKEDLIKVFNNLQPVEKLVRSVDERWFNLRIHPYRTTEDKVTGAVVTFLDVTEIKNAEEALSYQAEQQQAIADLGVYALHEKNLQSIVDKLADSVSEILDGEYTLLLEFNKDEKSLVFKGGNVPGDQLPVQTVNTEKGYEMGYALHAGDAVVINDYEKENKFDRSDFLSELDVRSGIAVVVQGVEQPYGILGIFSTNKRNFTGQEISFMKAAANLLAEAVERLQFEEQLEQTNRQLERRVKERTADLDRMNEALKEKIETQNQLQKEILEISDRERWYIAGFLHDELGQTLIAVRMLISSIVSDFEEELLPEDLLLVEELIEEIIQNVRELSHEVAPVEIEEGGVDYAFRDFAGNTEYLYKIGCSFENDLGEKKIESSHKATQLYRIAQEAVKNAAMHGEAEEITIRLTSEGDDTVLEILDDGIGYEDNRETEGMGIHIMQYRAELLGGELNIQKISEEGGTRVRCTIPRHQEDNVGSGLYRA